MAQNPNEFDYNSADLEAYLADVVGLNILYRNRMRKALRLDEDELMFIRAIYDEIIERQEKEDVRLMTPEFEEGFIRVFNTNADVELQIGPYII